MSSVPAEVQHLHAKAMTADEARRTVDQINDYLDGARRLLLELYEREGWRALGYKSWRECAVAEFQASQAHLYRLLNAARVERVVSPMGEIGSIPERALRPLVGQPEGVQRKVWMEAQRRAGSEQPPESVVREVRDEAIAQLSTDTDADSPTGPDEWEYERIEREALDHEDPAHDPYARAERAAALAESGGPAGRRPEHLQFARKSSDEVRREEEAAFLRTLPLKLDSDRCQRIYEEDALAFFRSRDHVDALRGRGLTGDNKVGMGKGWFRYQLSRFLRLQGPHTWLACRYQEKDGGLSCEGGCVGGSQCPSCKGNGYVIPGVGGN